MNPDNFVAVRYATLIDILDILETIIRPYMGNIPGACGPGGLPIGANPDLPQIGAFPGTVVLMIGGYQFIRPTLNGDEYDVAPFTKEDADNVREIAALLAFCRGAVVLLPPPAAKFGLDPIFDEVTAEIAKILQFQGIIYYKPALWSQLQLFDQLYPLDTLKNRRIFTRVFQGLMRIMEFYVTVREKYCANSMLRQSQTGEITSMFLPHDRDPDTFVVPPTWRRADVESDVPTAMPSVDDIRRSMGADEGPSRAVIQ